MQVVVSFMLTKCRLQNKNYTNGVLMVLISHKNKNKQMFLMECCKRLKGCVLNRKLKE